MSDERTAAAPAPATACYLDVGHDPMLCLLSPASGTPRTTAVLLCPPFGWDEMCSYRSRRAWAADLARRGYPSLRIDLPGTGDSGGGPEQPGLVQAWIDAVATASGWLRETTGAHRVAAAGIGLGGLLAWCAITAGAGIDDLILWGVPAGGGGLVRQLRAFARFEDAAAPEPLEGDPAALDDGGLASGGFRMSAETVAALEGIDLTALPLPAAPGRRVLLIGRDGVAADGRLREALAASEAAVSTLDGHGYGAMMAAPQVARTPFAAFDAIAEWLDAGAPTPDAAPAARPHAPAPAHEHGEMTVEGEAVRELALAIGQPFDELRGILTEPASGAPAAELCAVLLNPGAQRRIGPNRMWVEIARRWAAGGVPALRLDVAGIGDADGGTLPADADAALYVPGFVDQVRSALDALVARGLPPRFLLLGLCSGAYWGFHTALCDERVAGVAMLNPRALVWEEHLDTARDARRLRKLGQARTWRKIVRRDATLTSPLVIARALVTQPFTASTRREERRAGGIALEHALDRLDERGVGVTMAFSGSEPLHRELVRGGLTDRLGRWPNVTLDVLARGPETHTLGPRALQRRAHAALDRALERALERPVALVHGATDTPLDA